MYQHVHAFLFGPLFRWVVIYTCYDDIKFLHSVTGGELLTRLLNEDALTESDVAFYMRQLLLAVEHMHSRNVIHLDLKVEHLSYKWIYYRSVQIKIGFTLNHIFFCAIASNHSKIMIYIKPLFWLLLRYLLCNLIAGKSLPVESDVRRAEGDRFRLRASL